MTRARLQRFLGGAVAVAAVAVAGLWAGRVVRDWRSGPPSVLAHAESQLMVGTPFPEDRSRLTNGTLSVDDVFAATSGSPTSHHDLL